MDLVLEKMLSGVMVQGGKNRDKNVYMKKFRVGHSLDGEKWAIIKEDNTTKPKVGAFGHHGYVQVWNLSLFWVDLGGSLMCI